MGKKNRNKRKSTSCGAVVWRVHDGELELLLIKQFAHKDSWGIPKGHLDKGESFEQCARREVKEETGVLVTLGERLPDTHVSFKNESKTVVSYLANPVSNELLPGNDEPRHDDPDCEVADAMWISVNKLPKIHAYQQQLIAGAVEALCSMRWRERSQDEQSHC